MLALVVDREAQKSVGAREANFPNVVICVGGTIPRKIRNEVANFRHKQGKCKPRDGIPALQSGTIQAAVVTIHSGGLPHPNFSTRCTANLQMSPAVV